MSIKYIHRVMEQIAPLIPWLLGMSGTNTRVLHTKYYCIDCKRGRIESSNKDLRKI